MVILVGLSSLPFLHELIVDENGVFSSWVPDLNIQNLLRDDRGKILGYSKYRVFLYYISSEISILIAIIGWYIVARKKNRYYAYALLVSAISVAYHIFLILSNSRKTELNHFELKLIGTLILALIFFGLYYYSQVKRTRKLRPAYTAFGSYSKKIITVKVILGWLGLIFASTLIYFHDIITLPRVGTKDWVPNLGIVDFLTTSEGSILGFNTYRTFLLTLCLQFFAQLVWLGWLRDADFKSYKPFLIVPLGLSMHQLTMTLLDTSDTYLNKPDFKLVLILGIGVFVGIFYFFHNPNLTGQSNNIKEHIPSNSQSIEQQLE